MIKISKMNEKRFNEIVAEVHDELMDAPEKERDDFLLANWKEHSLTDYHHTLGTHIRNKYSLWSYTWEPELRDGVDYSSFHPDNISGRIIEEVWKLGNERPTSN